MYVGMYVLLLGITLVYPVHLLWDIIGANMGTKNLTLVEILQFSKIGRVIVSHFEAFDECMVVNCSILYPPGSLWDIIGANMGHSLGFC